MVSGYRDDKLSQNMNNSLSFKKKTFRIDWRKIAAVDLERVAKELDVYCLQDNIDHITFCNIENEIDVRMIDPNYVKLFKISQLTIEYLMHSQNYLTEVISNIETELNSTSRESEELKKTNDKMQKDLIEVKKENKKRKKLIETQQTLMNASASNYHQCAFCSKVFLNISYLQAHMARRHSDVTQFSVHRQNSEIEKELERIKERLRLTENDLMLERNSRLSLGNVPHQQSSSSNTESMLLIRQMEEMKNNEIKRQKEELRKAKENFKKEISELNDKNNNFERTIKDLQEKLGKQSHVGWMKDDIDIEKDTAIKQNQEIQRLTHLISNYESQIKQFEELKSKWKVKEDLLKKKLIEKDEKILSLKTRLTELENAANKTDRELVMRNQELLRQLEEEKQLRYQLEKELAELKNRPPPITPRQQSLQRTPSPQPAPPTQSSKVQQPPKAIKSESRPSSNALIDDIYLPEYCPLTLKAVQNNQNHLHKYRDYAVQLFERELDEMGIDLNEKGLSPNDFKQKMNAIKKNRPNRTDDLTTFTELRRVFAEISERYTNQKLNVSLRSSIGGTGGNRVKFKSQVEKSYNDYNKNPPSYSNINDNQQQRQHQSGKRLNESKSQMEESEETNDDVSISNALESEDDDDTEPTKSQLDTSLPSSPTKQTSSRQRSPTKGNIKKQHQRSTDNINQDDLSDLESISQLLSERSARNKKLNSNNQSNQSRASSVEETKKKLEKQFEISSKKGYKPTPNAVPVGFAQHSKKKKSKDDESYSSITDIDLDNEPKHSKQRNALRSSLQDSNSSSIWVSESHSNDVNPNNNQGIDRPPTANSSKTLNFESDDN